MSQSGCTGTSDVSSRVAGRVATQPWTSVHAPHRRITSPPSHPFVRLRSSLARACLPVSAFPFRAHPRLSVCVLSSRVHLARQSCGEGSVVKCDRMRYACTHPRVAHLSFWYVFFLIILPRPTAISPHVFSKHFKHFKIAARTDTDHTTGVGQVAITGRYDSRKDSFGVDAAYAIDDANTVYASYGVTDEKILGVGLETGLTAFGRRSTVDLVYNPPTDSATTKIAVRQGKTKLSGIFSFDNLRDKNINNTAHRYEVDAKLSNVETLNMSFDGKTKVSKLKFTRKLDLKNRFDAQYYYIDAQSKHISLTLKHQYSANHAFAVTTNYGSRKYNVEWDCKTENGPWTISTSFPFNASPHTGDWMIKRRFEF